jgi:hypothetical protein
MRPDDRRWRYFGCKDQTGHHLFRPDGSVDYDHEHHYDFTRLDGVLCPKPETQDKLYKAVVNHRKIGMIDRTILSFWDRTIDHRSGSNSNIIAPYHTEDPERLITEAYRLFPWLWKRFENMRITVELLEP